MITVNCRSKEAAARKSFKQEVLQLLALALALALALCSSDMLARSPHEVKLIQNDCVEQP
jgi:hypothetical protein